MELFEKINQAFGGWYEGLFGGSDDVRPKDILRRIFTSMEENRKEHLDDRVYVPNHYILEIAVDDEEEKEFLRSFLVREELETAVRRYCKQNHYEIRGGLHFTINEVSPDPEAKRNEKVRIRCRYDTAFPAATASIPVAESIRNGDVPVLARPAVFAPDDGATVASVYGSDEMGTVPAVALATLSITTPGRTPFTMSLSGAAITIGRSPNAGNDIILEEDVRVSRRHARIELDMDGQFTVYDLDSTNGTRVNGKKVDNRGLKSGDEIRLGESLIRFEQSSGDDGSEIRPAPSAAISRATGPAGDSSGSIAAARLILMDGDMDVDDYVLAAETIVGRGPTNDIVVDDRSVAARHVRIMRGEPFVVEVLAADQLTLLNATQLHPGQSVPLTPGDRISLGSRTLRFEQPEPES